jgi:hypothetical protein
MRVIEKPFDTLEIEAVVNCFPEDSLALKPHDLLANMGEGGYGMGSSPNSGCSCGTASGC